MQACGLALAGCLGLLAAGSAQAATWSVDPAKSKLGFTGTQTEVPFSGSFKTWSGSIDFDPAKPESAHVSVNIAVASATTGDSQRDEAMPQADWFDAGKIAEASFQSTGFTPKGGNDYETTGKLTLRGISKDVTLSFTLTIDGAEAHAIGKTKLVRTDFGVGQGSWSDGSMVGLDVSVAFDLVAERH